MLTIASGNIEIEKVEDVCRRVDIFRCISLISNSSIENSDTVPTVIAEREEGKREGEGEGERKREEGEEQLACNLRSKISPLIT